MPAYNLNMRRFWICNAVVFFSLVSLALYLFASGSLEWDHRMPLANYMLIICEPLMLTMLFFRVAVLVKPLRNWLCPGIEDTDMRYDSLAKRES